MIDKNIKIFLVIAGILFASVPLTSSQGIHENLEEENYENFLGEIWVEHGSPITLTRLIKHLWDGGTFKPVNESERHYYFPEIDGKVKMNFTLILHDKLDWPMPIPRRTRINLWVQNNIYAPNEIIYFGGEYSKSCKNVTWDETVITTYDMEVYGEAELETNGNDTIVQVGFYAGALFFGIIPSWLWGPMDWNIRLYQNTGINLVPKGSLFNITVHPIKVL